MAAIDFVTSPVWLPDSETVEVRPLCESVDVLAQISRDAIGLYPPEFFAQPALLSGGVLRVGICQCGSEGCDDITVEVTHQDGDVYWCSRRNDVVKKWRFDSAVYDSAIGRASQDLSWERTADTIYRLLKLEDFAHAQKQGWIFESGYMMEDGSGVNLYFKVANDGPQKLEVSCPTYEPELAIEAVRAYMNKRFS